MDAIYISLKLYCSFSVIALGALAWAFAEKAGESVGVVADEYRAIGLVILALVVVGAFLLGASL